MVDFRRMIDWTEEDDVAITEGDPLPYGEAPADLLWRRKSDFVVAYDGERPIGHAAVISVEISSPISGLLEVAGLGSVLVAPSYRGRGIGSQLVQQAFEMVRERGLSWMLLLCLDMRVSFYERLGWRALPGPVTVEQPGPVRVDLPVGIRMMAFGPEAEWLSAAIDVLGLPF
jgi:GNAT superfamily N-acetyltransferase